MAATAALRRKQQIRESLWKAENLTIEPGQAHSCLVNRFGPNVVKNMIQRSTELEELLQSPAKVVMATDLTRLTSPDTQENEVDHFYRVVICDHKKQWYVLRYFVGVGPGGTWRDELKYLLKMKKVDLDGAVRFVMAMYPLLLAELICQTFRAQGRDYWL